MLCQTHHHPFFFPFISFTPFSSFNHHCSSFPLLSSLSSIQAEQQEMECVEGALKSSFGPEMAVKTTQQPFFDDVWIGNSQSGVSGDDSFVDDLLDFSKGGVEDGFVEEEHEQDNKACSVSVSPKEHPQQAQTENDSDPSRCSFSVDDFRTELSVPADDLDDLEWLSHFVEESFSEFSLTFPAGKLTEKPTENHPEPEIPVIIKPCFTTPVQTKARSKRARTGGRVWSLESPSLTESSSSSSSSSTTSSPPPSKPWVLYTSPSQTAESILEKPSIKKQKKKQTMVSSSGAPSPRRCSHCLVQKTPQWRTGPLGAKTLCNACGVRYKSGRLLPEYRPACSPTFSSDVHSNHHRKVLEMRRKKEGAQTVQSF